MSTRYLLITLAYCIGLFILSSDSTPPKAPSFFPGEDKGVHAFLYAGLAAVVGTGIRRGGTTSPAFQIWFPVLFAVVYGFTDELHQVFVPNRQFDLWDLAADAAGAAAFQVFHLIWYRNRQAGTVLKNT